jgi:glycogen phosphorylase
MSPEERKKVNPRVVLFAGKAAPGYYIAKLVRAIHSFTSIISTLTADLRQSV